MIEVLDLIFQFVLNQFTSIWWLYAGGSVLGFAIVLWVLDRLFHIFDVAKR